MSHFHMSDSDPLKKNILSQRHDINYEDPAADWNTIFIIGSIIALILIVLIIFIRWVWGKKKGGELDKKHCQPNKNDIAENL
uniref:Uncharacterized protein n=1 Tax=Acrobeloides nanus TaxID=290746 RepID=A0A914E2D3_9BILA